MVLQRYGLVLIGLFIIALGIVGAPVLADDPPGSGGLVLMVDNSTTLSQPMYTFSVHTDVPSNYSGPVLMIVNSTPLGQTMYTVPAMKPSPPDSTKPFPTPVEATMSRTISGGGPVSAAPASVSPGDSLQAAIDAAADGDTIYLDPGTYYEHGITISKNITIMANKSAGGNHDNTIIDALTLGGIFSVTGAYSFAIDNLALRNATGYNGGGAVNAPSGSTLTITSTIFSNCSTNWDGGAIRSLHGTVTVTSSTFSNCSATISGGAISSSHGSLNVISTSFSDCSAPSSAGGAIYTYMSTVDITSSTFLNCSATNSGGAIRVDDGTLNVTSSTFSNCSAGAGGAIVNLFGTVNVISSTFSNCSAINDGGAIYSYSSTVTITSSTFSNCSATISGGAISSSQGTTNVSSSTFSNCSATDYGGAIFSIYDTLNVTTTSFSNCSAFLGGAIFFYYGTANVNSSTFSDCPAFNGGAINCNNQGTLTVNSSSFSNCSANTGGAILNYGNASIGNNSVFTGCSAAGGGAVYNGGSTFTITSSTISDCSADSIGGAVMSGSGTFNISTTSFSNCSAGNNGGAIYSSGGILNITTTTFSNCSAGWSGGAIYNSGSTLTISTSSFSNSTAVNYGGAIYSSGGTVTISFSSFDNCSATIYGGAISSDGSTLIVTTSSFSNCSALIGGAISSESSSLTITTTSFSNCSARLGGAIYHISQTLTVTSSTFSGCSAIVAGGAILSTEDRFTIASSTFSDCSTGWYGGAIYSDSTGTIHFSRFYQNTGSGSAVEVLGWGAVDATNNWWGANTEPSGFVHGDVDYTPWLTLGITASPSSITTAQTPTIRTNLTFNSSGYDTSGGGVYVPANITNTFAVIAGSGSVSPLTNGTVNGVAGTTFTPAYSGTTTISGTVDDQTVFINLTVAQGAPTVTAITPRFAFNTSSVSITNLSGMFFQNIGTTTVKLTRAGHANITAKGVTVVSNTRITCVVPITNQPAGLWNVVVTNPDGQEGVLANGFTIIGVITTGSTLTPPTPVPTYSQDQSGGSSDDFSSSGFLPLMNVTVNIGGNSAAGKTTVTGTKLSELIVTGTVQSGTGSNLAAPPGFVYQYISIVLVRYSSITKAVINFTVPQSWLDENHIAPGSIVLYRQTANGWESLPTTVLYTKDGTVYFSAQSGGFSLFAIAGTPTVQIPEVTVTTPQRILKGIEQTPAPAAVAKAPATTQTTVPPPGAEAPAGPSGFPVMTTALIAVVGIGLLGGGVLVRRWWIQW
jgi:PGF-pre-PGF domain-containing protein